MSHERARLPRQAAANPEPARPADSARAPASAAPTETGTPARLPADAPDLLQRPAFGDAARRAWVLRMQQTGGNRAVARSLQTAPPGIRPAPAPGDPDTAGADGSDGVLRRQPGPGAGTLTGAALEAAYQAAVRSSAWDQAAVYLNGFSDADIETKVGRLSAADRAAMRRAAPAWATRVTSRLLDADYREAIAAGTWGQAALCLNGFNDVDIGVRLGRLNPAQLLELKQGALISMPGWSSRIVAAINRLGAGGTFTNTTDTGNAYAAMAEIFRNGVTISKDVKFIEAGTFRPGKFAALKGRILGAVTSYLSNKYKLKVQSVGSTPQPGDGEYPITVRVNDNASASYPVTLHGGAHGRGAMAETGGNIYELGQATEAAVPTIYLAHESAHMILGASDEYANASVPGRVVTSDHSLMGDFYAQGIAAAEIKARHFGFLVAHFARLFPGRTISIVR
jgi:hypothetical protein